MILLLLEDIDARAILIFKIQAVRLLASGVKISIQRGKIPKSMNLWRPAPKDGRWEIG